MHCIVLDFCNGKVEEQNDKTENNKYRNIENKNEERFENNKKNNVSRETSFEYIAKTKKIFNKIRIIKKI